MQSEVKNLGIPAKLQEQIDNFESKSAVESVYVLDRESFRVIHHSLTNGNQNVVDQAHSLYECFHSIKSCIEFLDTSVRTYLNSIFYQYLCVTRMNYLSFEYDQKNTS